MTFREAERALSERLGPMSRMEQVACESLDARLRRIEREHREYHEELGTELCWACDWPLTDASQVFPVTLANGSDIRTCSALCASKVRDLVGKPT